LDVAEEAGLITSIGHQVIEGACQVLHDLREHHGHDPKVALSGNFSRAEFFRPDTRTFVQTMLDRYGIEPSHFTMEVTERAVGNGKMQDLTEIRRLKALGVRIEIDDFGTGYSSLMSLLDFPVDGLKFDKDMTEQLDGGGPGRAMVQSVLEMADRLGLSVTAEGIETDEQLDALRNLDCAYGQGYLFTRPVPAQSLHTLLDEAPWRAYWD
jgi:EAL domain-containing protein (putative c-di-GMP-specific phosphodiesterase class I)